VYLFKIYLILGKKKKNESQVSTCRYILFIISWWVWISIHIRPLYYFWLADKLRRRRWRWFCGLMKSIDGWLGPLSFQCAYKVKFVARHGQNRGQASHLFANRLTKTETIVLDGGKISEAFIRDVNTHEFVHLRLFFHWK